MAYLKVEGLQELLKSFDLTKDKANKFITDSVNEWADEVVLLAKQAAPVNDGKLRQSIQADYATSAKIQAGVAVAVNYAAYLEFGTRGYASAYVGSLPNDWKTYAASFKGKGGGTFDEFLLAIMDWVKSKGISGTYSVKTQKRTKASGKGANFEDAEVAYPIALAIIRKGIKPQPYLYPATITANKHLIDKLNKANEKL